MRPLPEPSSIASAPPQLATGTVCGRAGAWHFVRNAKGEQQRALVAPSCLLAPEDGDLVLLCHASEEPLADERKAALPCPLFVLAVLGRAEAGSGTLHLPGSVRLSADHGDLRIEGRGIELAATQKLHARTAHLSLDALQGDLHFGQARATAGTFVACLGELQLFAREVRSTLGRIVQKARSSFRTVEGLDDVRAGRARWEIEGHAQLHAKQATVLAEGAVKIDGARIDLG